MLARNDDFGDRTNTTIGVVATNATMTKTECFLVAQSAHDGFARALWPVHTAADGDAVVACSVGGVSADLDVVRLLTITAVAQAIRSVA
jgi:L-aminopeptidase/D-esterase-like protein